MLRSSFNCLIRSPASRHDISNLYTSIDKVISPLTAYCIGLADTCPELALFPQLADVEPGVFRYGTGTQDSWLDSGAVAV